MNALLRAADVDVYDLVHQRLKQWGRDKFYPGWAEPSPSAVLGRLMDEGRDSRLKRYRGRVQLVALLRRAGAALKQVPCKETRGVKMELVVHEGETVMCPPDGGVNATLARYAGAVRVSRECREVGELLVQLQDHNQKLWHVIRVTYRDAMTPAEIPRTGEGAAAMLNIAPSTYWIHRKKALSWLGRRLFPEHADRFLTDESESV